MFEARGLGKDYAERVLDGVDLSVAAGEIHALVGANGAGKSTLCRIVAGLTVPSDGSMTLDGKLYAPERKRDAEERGVQIVQQELNLVPTLSVAENLLLNRLPNRWGFVRSATLRQRAEQALGQVGLSELDPDTPTHSLGVGTQQLVEIAAALARPCRLLLLDEPTAALTGAETDLLFEKLQRLTAAGTGILYVSHRLGEIQRISNRLTLLRDGCRVASQATEGTTRRAMVALMTGEEHADDREFESHRQAEIAMTVEGLCATKAGRQLAGPSGIEGVSFVVHHGERLGIAGLVGAGRSELLRAIFGADRARFGKVSVANRSGPDRFSQPREAVAHGLALVTEERKRDGVLLPLPLSANVTLAAVPRRGLFLDRETENAAAERWQDRLAIHAGSIHQPVEQLSGGNQQKVVLAKWLECGAEVLLLDEPTRGIDVAARDKIHALFEQLAQSGKAMVIVSSDLDELMEQCDRILVLAEGQLVAEFERDSWTRAELLAAAFPVTPTEQALAAEGEASP